MVHALDVLYEKLFRRKIRILSFFNKDILNNSIYIYGKPGGGKTFIVNLFYKFIQKSKFKKSVLRVHFQEFMAKVHEETYSKRKKKSKKPLEDVASDISNKYILIVFDELEILDIADAMIVSKLFNKLLDKRVLFIITSNYYPDELYKNGLQRSQFLPFIDLIKERMVLLELNNNKDLRFSETVKSSKKFLFPLNILTTVLKSLLTERIPISDLRKILEKLSTINNKNLSPYELAEIIRPTVVGLLIQQLAPLNQALPIITFSGNLEQMILNIANQSGENGLILEPSLIQKIVSSINNAIENLQNENKKPVLITAPAIRKDISLMLRQHIDNVDVLSFTELPDDKKIDVVATITLDQEEAN